MTGGRALYPTARAVLLMAAGVPVALVVGVVWPLLWTAAFGWALFVLLLIGCDALLAARGATPEPVLTLPGSAPVGGAIEARLRLPGAHDGSEAALDGDPKLAPSGSQRRPVRNGGARFAFRAIRRGTARLPALWLRRQGPLGLVWRQRREPRDEAVLILPDIAAVRERGQLLVRQALPGETARRETGAGAEFQSLVAYQQGMDRRAIDWKQSARHATLLAKDWRIERNNQIVLAIDCGRAMIEPLAGQPRLDRAISAALLAAYVALKLDDRVGLYAYADRPVAAGAIASGIAAFPALQRLAAGIDYGEGETNHTLGLTRLAQRLDRRTLIILFTEFTDPTSAELMVRAAGSLLSRHLLLFLIFRDEELESLAAAEPEAPEDVTRAVAAQALIRERAIVATRLRRMGVHVVEARRDAAGSALVDAYLELKRQRLL
ncbi:MAG TPA: DUF58 domain-containing protein [Sphingomonas sp.]|nr:DUF58 domain-containing protein [Sphingomonas sp.]